MKNNTIHLVKVLGIPISLDTSWFLIFALITWVLAINYLPADFSGWSGLQYWAVAALISILFFACVLLHELGHSLMAVRYKLQVKSINLYLFGGSSEITSEPANARSEFVIASAGPVMSLALAGVFYVISVVFKGVVPIYAMSKYLAFINAILAAFNLIPGYPLDGGRVVQAVLWGLTRNLRRATEITTLMGHAIAFLFILLGVWQLFQGNWFNGVWIAFTGWFLETAVVGQAQQERVRTVLSGHTVEQIMSRDCAAAPADMPVQEVVDQYFLERGQRCLVVMGAGQPVGFITLHNIRQVPKQDWANLPVSDVMIPIDKVKSTGPKVGLSSALEQMGHDGVNQMPVMEDGQIAGLLSREDIVNYLHMLQKLEK